MRLLERLRPEVHLARQQERSQEGWHGPIADLDVDDGDLGVDRPGGGYPGTFTGIKDSSGDLGNMQALVKEFPGLAVLAGADPLMLPLLKDGGAGCITATSNLVASDLAFVFRHHADPTRAEEVEAAQARIVAARNLAYLVGDWTQGDAAIGALLRQHGREGVPLYLVYPAGGGAPAVLPQVLTEGIVLRAVAAAAAATIIEPSPA